ncbi:MAG: glutamate mutase L [Chloroflexi bacterium]|nr:glutamate mutase L [Chloroflexota bacterium]
MNGSLRPAPESLLGVDIGTAFTKASLFEPVEGQYRLIARGQARTTAGTHVYEGLARACEPIERITGRRLFKSGEPVTGDVSGRVGVEIMAVSVTCQPAIEVLATNTAAARAASGERCRVVQLAPASPGEQIGQMLRKDWDAVVGDGSDLTLARACLDVIGRRRPTFISGDGKNVRAQLAEVALRLARSAVRGLPELEAAATEPLVSGASALLSLTMLIATRFGLRLSIVDCGASQTMMAYASPDMEWLRLCPRDHSALEMPVSADQLRARHAELEASLRSCVDDDFSADLLLGSGAVAHFQGWAQPALTLLDGVQPAGVIQFALDTGCVVSQIASFAGTLPDIASRIFEQDGLTGLGAAVCPRGSTKLGTKAIEVRWKADSNAEDQSRTINAGELVRIPLGAGAKASLSLFPAKPVDVGLNRPGVAATAQVDGGRVGLIVDARFEPDGANNRDQWERQLA